MLKIHLTEDAYCALVHVLIPNDWERWNITKAVSDNPTNLIMDDVRQQQFMDIYISGESLANAYQRRKERVV